MFKKVMFNRMEYKIKKILGIRKNTNHEIFDEIYEKNLWGGDIGKFYSGWGSHDENINPYINVLKNFIISNEINSVCDIGCGDYNIMKQVINSNVLYYGIDIVAELIKYNEDNFGSDTVKFYCMDVTKEKITLPDCDLVVIRQVLQHLNNNDIKAILDKIKQYKYTIITEHVYDGENIKYNLEKETGPDTRVDFNSGVYIEKDPFNIRRVENILEIRLKDSKSIIRTSLIVN